MRIAQVAPLFERVPPVSYGGTERVVAYLTEALVEQGHEVTLFASGDSVTKATLVPIINESLRLSGRSPDWLPWHMMMMDRVVAAAGSFDVIHFHVDYVQALLKHRRLPPCLTTLHGRVDLPDVSAFLQHFCQQHLITISESQRAQLPKPNGWRATVHHGLPQDMYAFHPVPQNYFAFVGRICPEKRLDRAIEIAIACGVPLRIAAKVDDADQVYFDSQIKHLLSHPLIDYIGEIDETQKNEFIGNARALLFPIDWPEPFGMVMIEAFACGTPVLAYRNGSVPEVMEEGVTGFVVEDQAGAMAAARTIVGIDRRACRQVFEKRFTSKTMAKEYEALYRRLQPITAAPHDEVSLTGESEDAGAYPYLVNVDTLGERKGVESQTLKASAVDGLRLPARVHEALGNSSSVTDVIK